MECRGVYIDMLEGQIGSLHPLLSELVKQCLHNVPEKRPSTEEVLANLQVVKLEVEGNHECSPIKVDMVRVRLAKKLKKQVNINQVRYYRVYIANNFIG